MADQVLVELEAAAQIILVRYPGIYKRHYEKANNKIKARKTVLMEAEKKPRRLTDITKKKTSSFLPVEVMLSSTIRKTH